MKISSFIPPLIALAISLAWIGTRQQVLAEAEEAHDMKKLLARALELNRSGTGSAKMRTLCEKLTNDETLVILEDFPESTLPIIASASTSSSTHRTVGLRTPSKPATPG